jgi:Ca2+-binding RTX toxin-like protein
MANVNGTAGRDLIHRDGDGLVVPPGYNEIIGVTNGADTINGDAGDDTIYAGGGDDIIDGGAGDDVIVGQAGNDTVRKNVGTAGIGDGSDRINLGSGSDVVEVNALVATNVRLTFTSAEVGNGVASDSGTLANQDGGLAVRLQAELLGTPAGQISRVDDEGITFVGGAGVTFDVRDLVSGAARGENFEVVTLGTNVRDVLSAVDPARPYYINAGQGDDAVGGGQANDFLVGGAGNDSLAGGDGNDFLLGGAGGDVLSGGAGDDTAIINASTDGKDRINLGDGNDRVNVGAAGPGQVRLTFTSSEVGNGAASDSGMLANQDGFLAVRMRLENAQGSATGDLSRLDDEGVTFVSTTAGLTFDVRDLVSGVARGDQFEVVTLGTKTRDVLSAIDGMRPHYINGGQGNDAIGGGDANDFLVGGAGNDNLSGGDGNDSLLGGGGDDVLTGGAGNDTAIINASTDGKDRVNLGDGNDLVNVGAAGPGQIRLTFTSSEVGNGMTSDSDTMSGQDGFLAVRMRLESAQGSASGDQSRFDDEGITFASTTAGLTFDVRDLVSGVARGNHFEVVTLGTNESEMLTAVQPARAYYINAGQGDDTVTGGVARDFLVGGAGNDTLDGGIGNDSLLGGGGQDKFLFSTTLGATNVDTVVDFNVADDSVVLDSSVFAGLMEGMLSADEFVIGTAATDASDRVIYDMAGGRLLFDRDGSGTDFAAVQFAGISTNLAITNADFMIA